jgi:hypothetical protein
MKDNAGDEKCLRTAITRQRVDMREVPSAIDFFDIQRGTAL